MNYSYSEILYKINTGFTKDLTEDEYAELLINFTIKIQEFRSECFKTWEHL